MNFRTLLQIFTFSLVALTAKAQLTGEWTDENGACYKIRQVENQVFWYMDGRPRVINVFMGYLAGNTITGTWADVPGGNILGSGTLALRVENQNRMVKIDQNGNYGGSVWTRGSCSNTAGNMQGSRPDLSGTWYDYSPAYAVEGAVSTIKQNGNNLVFTNTFNSSSEGSFLDNTSIIANAWAGGLKATLEDNNKRIVWSNGSVWERNLRVSARPILDGVWYDYSAVSGYSGAISYIKQNGDKLVFKNSFEYTSDGYFLDNSTVIATAWEGGLKATLEDNGRKIVWTNGSVWQRSKR